MRRYPKGWRFFSIIQFQNIYWLFWKKYKATQRKQTKFLKEFSTFEKLRIIKC
jgi:hypothetical protein